MCYNVVGKAVRENYFGMYRCDICISVQYRHHLYGTNLIYVYQFGTHTSYVLRVLIFLSFLLVYQVGPRRHWDIIAGKCVRFLHHLEPTKRGDSREKAGTAKKSST